MGGQQSKQLNNSSRPRTSSQYSQRQSSTFSNDSELVSTSDASSTTKAMFKKKFTFGKKKMQSLVHDSQSCSSVSSSKHSLPSPIISDNIVTTAAKLSAIYDQEQAALYSPHSFSPCAMTQSPEAVLCSSDNDETSSSNISIHDMIVTPPESLDWPQRKQQTRTTLTSQDLVLDLYLGPNSDNDRKKEKDRQQRLHYLLKKVWKFIYRAELTDPTLIVHWCCGIGIWDMEMAGLFPNAQVVGIDFKEATFPNLRHGIPNLDFKITVIHDNMTGLESFDDNTVDYVLIRDAWLMMAPVSKWDNILRQVYRVLKPGGSIELSEHTLTVTSEGPYTKKMMSMYAKLYDQIEVDYQIATKLGGYLERAGYDSVDQQSIAIPLGEWSPSPDLKEMGYLFKDLIERRVRGLEKWVAQVNHVDQKELSDIVTKALIDEVDKYHAYIDWFSYTAKKPIS